MHFAEFKNLGLLVVEKIKMRDVPEVQLTFIPRTDGNLFLEVCAAFTSPVLTDTCDRARGLEWWSDWYRHKARHVFWGELISS